MGDDKTKTGRADRDRVNVDEPYELADWPKKWGVSHDKLKEATKKVDSMVKDVQKELAK